MNVSTGKFAIHVVADRVGIAVDARMFRDDKGDYCELVPLDVHPNEGFAVQLRLGWRSAEAVFVPGPFSAPLIARMGESALEGRQTFGIFAQAATSRKIRLRFRVNEAALDPMEGDSWPAPWSKIELSLTLTPVVIEVDNEAQHERLVIDLVVPLFAMIVALIGTEENALPTTGEPEGRAIQTLTTRYERSKLNREACIQLKGTRCTVCGFDFAEHYGTLGIGYTEVHHLLPVSKIGTDYRIDVASDLAPLCANCHAMVHREVPPISLDHLTAIVNARRGDEN